MSGDEIVSGLFSACFSDEIQVVQIIVVVMCRIFNNLK